MLNYYVDGQPVEGPLNLDGLTLRKGRSLKYWGFLYRKLGYVEGLSNLQFTESQTVDYLRKVFARDGVQASTTFRIDQDGAVLYEGFLDYTKYSFDGQAVSLALSDNRAVVDLETGATTTYSIDPVETIALHSRRLGGLVQLLTDPKALTIQRSSMVASALTHTVPLTKKSDTDETVAGTLAAVVNPLYSDPIYYNTTGKEQTVTLRGVVSVSAAASSTVTAVLTATAKGSEVEAIQVAQFSVTATPTLLRTAVDISIRVTPGNSLKLEWTADATVNWFVFTYDDKTLLSVTDEAYPASTGYGLGVDSLFAQLVAKATGGKLSLISNYFSQDQAVWIGNGAGVRGIQRPIQTSLQALFDGLTSLFNLAMWVDGDTVRIEPKRDTPKIITRIEDVISLTEMVATDYLYNTVQVGYTDWRSDGTLSNEEPNGQRSYVSEITTVRNGLNLLSSLIGTSSLIEQQRRNQFNPKTASGSTANAMDDRLFVVCARAGIDTDYKAETLESVDSITGVLQPETLYNVASTPARNLSRWSNWVAGSGRLSLQTVQGSSSLQSSYDSTFIDEAGDFLSSPSMPMLVTLETPMTLDEYALLTDWIEYPIGRDYRTGELLDAVWRKTRTGATVTLTMLQR